jgi:hypothetical protein
MACYTILYNHYILQYMPIRLLHDLKLFNSPHVMACNGHVITFYYMPLHVLHAITCQARC